jgi:hypothetical protein
MGGPLTELPQFRYFFQNPLFHSSKAVIRTGKSKSRKRFETPLEIPLSYGSKIS